MSKKDDMKADEAATTCQAPQKEESQPDKGQLNSERIYDHSRKMTHSLCTDSTFESGCAPTTFFHQFLIFNEFLVKLTSY